MKTLTWYFPLPRPHTGILLGNGVQGLMVWGDDRLCITIGRAGFWDHRDATPFTARVTYRQLRRWLEAGDEASVRAAFASQRGRGAYRRPCQIGGGRLELTFARNARPVRGALDTSTGTVTVTLSNGARVVIRQAMDDEVAWVDSPVPFTVRLRPTWEWVGRQLAADGVKPPRRWRNGFLQTLPEDDPLAIAWAVSKSAGGRQRLTLATALGPAARATVEQRLQRAPRADRFWREYWRDVPRVEWPDPVLQRAWDYGLYKQAGLTTPGGVPATLQGPWMEEYQLPPWSNDYHFNINIQMIYGPALPTNRLAHFEPLWNLLRGWWPLLERNAEKFFETRGALLLPHAVDDRCGVVGSFWTGTIDHACTAWMAQMAWLHYRYSLDETLLRELAWPLLTGAFNGYWAMLENFALPVSVSPEYNGASMNAWGRNASFQLAALHFLAQTLPQAARQLGRPLDPRWQQVRDHVPPYSLVNGRIGLWEGQDLAESHRHHSHLGAIYPFRSIDPLAPAHREVVTHSLVHWQAMGAGRWTGWCVPWASMLCSRCNLADAAVTWLHWWYDVFTNLGDGTLHDSDFDGVGGLHSVTPKPEVMQMDAGMGALTAMTELLVQSRGDALHILPAWPRRWRELEFDGLRTEGACRVGATVRDARLRQVRLTSEHGGPVTVVVAGRRHRHRLRPGQRWTLDL